MNTLKINPRDPLPFPARGGPLKGRAPKSPSKDGEFPASVLETFSVAPAWTNEPFVIRPFVLDTNVLRNDLLRAAHTTRKTALLDAGSSGGVRLFCAQHVPQEIDEHLPEWVPNELDIRDVREIWDAHYLPLIRVVTVDRDPPLTGEEKLNIGRLRIEDEDDVPTAILGVLINAPVLTMDRPLMRAVYGQDVDVGDRGDWLNDVLAGRALTEADSFLESGLILLNTVGKLSIGGVAETIEAVSRMPRAGRIATLFAFGVGMMRYGEGIGRRLGTLGRAIMALAEEISPVMEAWQQDRGEASARLNAGLPTAENLEGGLAWRDMPEGVLVRACARVLSRSMPLSARGLANVLPQLPVAQHEAKVRYALRNSPMFHRVTRGRWQLGRPLNRACSTAHR